MARSATRDYWGMQLFTGLKSSARSFLARFRPASDESFKLLETDCRPNEIAARFILSRSHYRSSNLRVKPIALEPSGEDRSTSVFRIVGLSEPQIWRLGSTFVAEPRKRNIHARAELTVESIQALTLVITPSEPPPRHALIRDWPADKSAAMSIAQQLAAECTLVLHP